jgi:RNA polymerase sigma factor (TIGR02999 family)
MEHRTGANLPTHSIDEITRLMSEAAQGGHLAGEELFSRVYEELRSMAAHRMAAERQDHTLDATALVHEAYLRMMGNIDVRWTNRAHFFYAAAEAMRRILVEHARGKNRLKRGGGRRRDLNGLEGVADLVARSDPEEILAVDEAIGRLELENPEAAKVVRLRFYAGLSPDETAHAADLSPRTVYRLWAYARAWLFRELKATL